MALYAKILKLFILFLIKHFRNFPGGSVVKNPPAKAGDMDSIPDPGTKIPHVSEQLNLCTTTKAYMS